MLQSSKHASIVPNPIVDVGAVLDPQSLERLPSVHFLVVVQQRKLGVLVDDTHRSRQLLRKLSCCGTSPRFHGRSTLCVLGHQEAMHGNAVSPLLLLASLRLRPLLFLLLLIRFLLGGAIFCLRDQLSLFHFPLFFSPFDGLPLCLGLLAPRDDGAQLDASGEHESELQLGPCCSGSWPRLENTIFTHSHARIQLITLAGNGESIFIDSKPVANGFLQIFHGALLSHFASESPCGHILASEVHQGPEEVVVDRLTANLWEFLGSHGSGSITQERS
mmetsp:Transcript_13538/g.29641  ORF Transcript_13538/g.29641 Transcript_13538/m.29641 type:complete len:275 (-) Transcript_13538:62-886(-)